MGASWVLLSFGDASNKHTVPLRGVSSFDGLVVDPDFAAGRPADDAGWSGAAREELGEEGSRLEEKSAEERAKEMQVAWEDFASTLEEDDGAWRSVASQKANASFWFGKDAVEYSQTFVFSDEQGWQSAESVNSEVSTQWNLTDTTFALDLSEHGIPTESFGFNELSLAFGEAQGDEIEVRYAIAFEPNGGIGKDYREIQLEGVCVGTIQHQVGKNSFEMDIEDGENEVLFHCEGSDDAGDAAKKLSLEVDLTTESVLYTWGSNDAQTKTFWFKGAVFTAR